MAQLQFKGKQFVQNHHLTVKFHELVLKKDKSLAKKAGLNDNLIIHGDNLKALKALLPTYGGKVKCVYIDPPYNTGNEKWKYNDNVNSPMMQEWLGKVVDREDLTRHDKWLCMMTPRLKLLRELLRDDGVIFISIDNNEQHRLRFLFDEIFGEENFVGQLIWRKKEGGGQTDEFFVTEHEYILVYRKTSDFKWIDEEIPLDQMTFGKEDKDGKYNLVKLAKWGTGAKREDRPGMYFSIKSPDEKNIYPKAPDGNDGRWRVGKNRMNLLIDSNLIQWEKRNNEWVPYEKVYFEKGDKKVIKERSILFDLATTGDGTNELTEIFGKKDLFENPKSSVLIKFLISHSTDKDSIILDSFAGSGTTGHAVLDLNKEDGLPAPRLNTFSVYAIKCDDASLYIGQTEDLRKRWQEHTDGVAAEWTKRHKPLYIAHYEEYSTREDAVKREKELKTGFGRKWLKREIEAGRARQAGGNRKFILVEMEDYADKITAERVRRVIKRYANTEIPLAPFAKGGINKKNAFVPPFEKGRLGGIYSPTFSYFELGKPIEMESILSGKNLPTYKELARYVFYTATGEEFDEKAIDEKNNFIGESKEYKVYLFYKPDIEYLKNTALTLDRAKAMGKYTGKKRLVFAPTKYLDQDHLDQLRIDFAQLPFEIYKLTE